ncbi:NAD(P)-binding domain-containing protein, partial [Bacillus cereus group sp. BC327]
SILFDSGLAANLKPGTAIMVSATISAQDAKDIEAGLKPYHLLMLDAPVSGGAIKAEAGDMTIMASGSIEAFTKLAPVLAATAGKVYNIGT